MAHERLLLLAIACHCLHSVTPLLAGACSISQMTIFPSASPVIGVNRRVWLAACAAGLAGLPAHAQGAAHSSPWPSPLQLDYDVSGQARGIPYRATSRLRWQLSGNRYEAELYMHVRLLGGRTQTSSGLWTGDGLRPERYVDQARRERRYDLDWAQQRFRFSREGQLVHEGALHASVQDRLSVFFALALQAGQRPLPARSTTPWQVWVINQRGPESWSYTDHGAVRTETPAGSRQTRQLERLPGEHNDTQMTLWLDEALGWLPARILLQDPNGDVADQRLRLAS